MTAPSTARRVILHAGLHKTGTTSLQSALAQGGAFVYPEVPAFGPGHAVLAWHAVGHRAIVADPLALVRTVRTAAADGPSGPVVLSSEEFLGMVRDGRSAAAVRLLVDEFPTELVLTLRPDPDRLPSFAAERILQGFPVDLDNYWEEPLRHLSFDPGLLGRFLALADWAHVHVIVIDPQRPDHLLRSFEDIVGTPIGRTDAVNVGSSQARLAILNELNRGPAALDLPQAWGLSREVAARLGPFLPDGEQRGLGPLPDEVRLDLEGRWRSTAEQLRSTARAGTLTVHGALPERSTDEAEVPAAGPRPHRRPPGLASAVVLHTGLPKTGSSALQVFLARNAGPLRRLGLRYPPTGSFASGLAGRVDTGNGIDLAVAALRLQRGEDATGPAGIAMADAIAGLVAAGGDPEGSARILISSELLAHLERRGLGVIRAGLAPLDVPLRAVIVVRDPVDLTGATYMQHLRRGERRGLAQWWDEEGRRVIRHRLETPLRLADVLGDDAVTVVAYRDPTTDPASVVRAVLRAAVAVDDDVIEAFLRATDVEFPLGRLNATLGATGRELLRACNVAGIPADVVSRLDERLAGVLPAHHRSAPVMDEHLAGWVRRVADPVLVEVAGRLAPGLVDRLEQERGAGGVPMDDAAVTVRVIVEELASSLERRTDGGVG